VGPGPYRVREWIKGSRALLHAIDRQQLVDTLQAGLTAVAHSRLHPSEPEHKEIAAGIPHYDYEPRRALQLVEALGYARGTDGVLARAATRPTRGMPSNGM